jgi:small ligand-binding sensory domain FIST
VQAAAAISTHPIAAMATGEAVGQLLEARLDHLDVLCCFVTSAHAGALEDIMATLDTLLSPAVLVGAAAAGVVGPTALVDDG